MKPHYEDGPAVLYHGDCIEVMRGLPESSVDAIVTDPPYGLGFMGREWDDLPPGLDFAVEALRVLKPGGHLLAFGGSRTWHRLAVAVEDAGFEVRDSIAWLYGSGFPKSLDVSKAIDKAAGAEREVVGSRVTGAAMSRGPSGVDLGTGGTDFGSGQNVIDITAPATPDAERWQGWGTALKPAFEPIVVARKPLVGTVAANVLAHGTGALNIDGCRVEGVKGIPASPRKSANGGDAGGIYGRYEPPPTDTAGWDADAGRWPANVILDESQAAELDRQSGVLTSGANPTRRGSDKFRNAYGDFQGQAEIEPARGADSGGASRFFPTFRYEAKAPTSERPKAGDVQHPTVKPLALMRWLVRLVTPPGGTVLEPFAGSGTTLEAALAEGFNVIGIEREADYLPLIMSRLQKPIQQTFDFGGAA